MDIVWGLRPHPILWVSSVRMNFSAVILAGGRSRRMGCDKAFLPFEGGLLIEHSVRVVRDAGAGEVLISGRAEQDFSMLASPLLPDRTPDSGPLGGIERGLEAANHELVLVLAVDLPHMTSGFLRQLLESGSGRSRNMDDESPPRGSVPVVRGGLEPLAAFYPRAAKAVAHRMLIEKQLAARDFARACLLQGWISAVPVCTSDARCFVNWNTPSDVAGSS